MKNVRLDEKAVTLRSSKLDRVLTWLLVVTAIGTLWISLTGLPVLSLLGRPAESAPQARATLAISTDSPMPRILRGSPQASTVVIEFADFECPFCEKYFSETFDKINREFIVPGKVAYGFRHFPLAKHALAVEAALATECAGTEGKFWELHDRLFQSPYAIRHSDLLRYAGYLGLDVSRFERCLTSPESERGIREDYVEGRRLDVSATPTFFVGQKTQTGGLHLLVRINGAQPWDVFEHAIETGGL